MSSQRVAVLGVNSEAADALTPSLCHSGSNCDTLEGLMLPSGAGTLRHHPSKVTIRRPGCKV